MKLLLPLLGCLAFTLSLTEGVMVCYFGSWAVYRQGDGKFDIEDIDPNICTHLVFGFAGLGQDNKIKVLDPWNELCDNYGKCGYDRFNALKQKNTKLITILAVGGWNEGSAKYSNMAADPAKRKKFVDSSIELLKTHGFDGLDMDWEYPTQRGGKPADKENFILLLADLKEALHANGMLLTAAVSAGKATIDPAYDVPGMAQNLDIVNVMAYDLHGAWDTYTHHQSGLYAHPEDTGDNVYLNQDFAITYWIEKGMPANKITQGVPLYGRCWTLKNGDDTGYYAPAPQPGAAGQYTRTPGFLGYNEARIHVITLLFGLQICEGILNGWTVVNDPAMNEPYIYSLEHGRIWCSYDDEASVKTKAEYAKAHGLAGMMVWSVETDDFKGKCGRPFNLIKTMVETFTGTDITPGPTVAPTTRDPDAPTTKPHTAPPTPPSTEDCLKPGINADPVDCNHYWLCSLNMEGGYDANSEPCAPGTLFNPNAYICDWDHVVCAIPDICPNECA
ncbi:Acidic mammalian chitinase [Chionoecetes opilio]|uniref:Acidic mammalian chitinase n=1 Tax=Chionoecetes opilio TaxID=41210 RepID=A0A8J4XPF4_CHIOP|nr:Acidic mammalian chitinase [Chionoecetes opilio]